MDEQKLAQLMCSRICHDLITPVGAIATGFELMVEGPSKGIDSEMFALANQSAHTASKRLVYYRSAFGIAGTSFLSVADDVLALIREYLNTYGIQLTQQGAFPSDFTACSRILLTLMGV